MIRDDTVTNLTVDEITRISSKGWFNFEVDPRVRANLPDFYRKCGQGLADLDSMIRLMQNNRSAIVKVDVADFDSSSFKNISITDVGSLRTKFIDLYGSVHRINVYDGTLPNLQAQLTGVARVNPYETY